MNKTWEASGLTSPDGETVELASNLVIDGAVEMWLAALEGAMQTALQKLLASSLQAYKCVRVQAVVDSRCHGDARAEWLCCACDDICFWCKYGQVHIH